jgi:hypothetical protein
MPAKEISSTKKLRGEQLKLSKKVRSDLNELRSELRKLSKEVARVRGAAQTEWVQRSEELRSELGSALKRSKELRSKLLKPRIDDMTRAASFDHLVVASSSTMSSYRPSLRPSSSAGVRDPVELRSFQPHVALAESGWQGKADRSNSLGLLTASGVMAMPRRLAASSVARWKP